MKPDISACLVIRNEEENLTRCLESITYVVREIIIVHDGQCTDSSLQIAKKFQANIFIREFIGEAEYHRPFTFQNATSSWILQIDADEFLSRQLQVEIPKLVVDDKYDAYSFSWPYPEKNSYLKKGPFAKTVKSCLFRKNKLYMLGISHEYPKTFGKLKKRIDLLLEHKPSYDNFTFGSFQQKWHKWALLQAHQIYYVEQAPTYKIPSNEKKHAIRYFTFMRRHPVISGIHETAKFLIIYFRRGILLSNLKTWQIAVMELAYLWLVRINLLKLKYEK